MLVKEDKWSTPYEPVFYVVCTMNLCFMLCAAFVVPKKNSQTVCRDASRFMLANAVIYTTDKPGKNEELQTPQAVPDLGIPERDSTHCTT